jgi:hypothetical protein
MPLAAAIALPIYTLLLPFLMLLLLIPGFPAEDAWFLKASFTVLAPFSSTLWFIIVRRRLTHERSRYSAQLGVFVGTGVVVMVMLKLGIYSLA